MPPNVTSSAACARLAHAETHIARVESELSEYLSAKYYNIQIADAPDASGYVQVKFNSLHSPDERINAIIGDAVGNIRSALDYVAVGVLTSLGVKSDAAGFPFAGDRAGFERRVRDGSGFGRADSNIIEILLNIVQAYPGGAGHELWVLNKLRNIDKHRFLLTVTKLAGFVASWKIGTIVCEDCKILVQAGESGLAIRAPARGFIFTERPRPEFHFDFAEPGVIDERPVVDFLKSAARKTACVVRRLEAAALASA